MKDGKPFRIGGLWENWKDPTSGEWIRTFAVITTDANEMAAEIHDRMPLILAPTDYTRWLSEEPDPSDLMRPYAHDTLQRHCEVYPTAVLRAREYRISARHTFK